MLDDRFFLVQTEKITVKKSLFCVKVQAGSAHRGIHLFPELDEV